VREAAELLEEIRSSGKYVVVAGIGKSGTETAYRLKERGFKVFLIDEAVHEENLRTAEKLNDDGFDVCLGFGASDNVKRGSLLVVSPGIPPFSKIVKKAAESRIPLVTELDLAFLFMKEKPAAIVAVTGTNGKSTVASLIYEILKNRYKSTILAGNIGTPFITYVDEVRSDTGVVLEVSSFQLYYSSWIRFDLGVILNITPDHFDWHRSFEEYAESKFKMAELLSRDGKLILNAEDPVIYNRFRNSKESVRWFALSKEKPGINVDAFVEEGWIWIKENNEPRKLLKRNDFRLIGDHNTENLLASVLAARMLGVSIDGIVKGVNEYKPLHHRMEVFMEYGALRFIDDSKATNSDAAYRAVKSLHNRIVLLAGGRAKESDFSKLARALKDNGGAAVVFGEAGELLEEQFKKESVPVKRIGKMKNAVEFAFRAACLISQGYLPEEALVHASDYKPVKESCKGKEPVDVLLSPACASFDEFSGYAERGDRFQEIIKQTVDEISKE
jgi:UDP-N-acetylmuramoylalanine--D-glutamate ligase